MIELEKGEWNNKKKMYQGAALGFNDQLDVGGFREMEESRLALTFLV